MYVSLNPENPPLMCMPQRLLDIMPVEYYAWWTIKAPNIDRAITQH